jgi:hypothetical protein
MDSRAPAKFGEPGGIHPCAVKHGEVPAGFHASEPLFSPSGLYEQSSFWPGFCSIKRLSGELSEKESAYWTLKTVLRKQRAATGSANQMIPFYYSSRNPIRSLPKLLAAYNARGGSIIEYQRVASCVVASQKSSKYVWVPPDANRVLRSLPYTLSTLLFGWWSFTGLVWTIQALITNLGGGRDATEELLNATNGGNVELAQQMVEEEIQAQRRQSIRALGMFFAIVVGVVLFFWALAKICDWSDSQRKPDPYPMRPVKRPLHHAGN